MLEETTLSFLAKCSGPSNVQTFSSILNLVSLKLLTLVSFSTIDNAGDQ
jgi:hypothetical protein